MYQGLGVHHVGMGVQNFQGMKQFYQEILECTKVWEEFPEIWNAMTEVFRTSHHKFAGIMFGQEAEGVVVELISMSIPLPRPIRKDKKYGDIGVNKITVAVKDVEQFYKEYNEKIKFAAQPQTVGVPAWGDYNFIYARDPENNLIEFISGPKVESASLFGGVRWLGVSVTDLERSMDFYQKYVGFDTVVVKPHENFSGLVDEVSGANGTKVRSCLLANSKGGGMLELYELLKPRGRSIPLNTYWGDFGYLEVALWVDDIHSSASYFREEGLNILHSPCMAFDGPEIQFWFAYTTDPDGIPVELIAAMPKK
jgi:catechol 2,3-dioxygenase-like lactoylglutathione lyase family enzyme